MAAILTLAGPFGSIDVRVSDSGPSMTWVEIGDRDRTDNGAPVASVRTRKRVWAVPTIPMDPADVVTLRAALQNAPDVTASGVWFGTSTATVCPKLGRDTPIASVPFSVAMNFTLEEA